MRVGMMRNAVIAMIVLACAGSVWAQPGAPAQCSSPAIAIPDNTPAGTSDDIVVSASGLNVIDLEVYLDITHTWVGDLIIDLEHVDTATSATLVDRPAGASATFGCNGNNMDLTLADGEALSIENDCTDVTASEAYIIGGRYQPGDPPADLMANWASESFDGTWRLTVSDNAGGDTGTLNTWCVDPGVPVDVDLSLVKDGIYNPDNTITYSFTVTNNGPGDATGVVVTDALDACLAYVSDDCGGMDVPPWTWNVGSLSNAASAVCNLVVDASTCTGPVTNAAAVTGDQNDPNTGDNADSITLSAGGPLAIPTLDTVGLAILLLLLAGAAVMLLRRRMRA